MESIEGPNGEELVSANPTPEPGQVWADNDERTKGSGEFEIAALIRSGLHPSEAYAIVKRSDGSNTRIRLDRFADTGSRGYRYIGRAR
jgi:hypothetical protein